MKLCAPSRSPNYSGGHTLHSSHTSSSSSRSSRCFEIYPQNPNFRIYFQVCFLSFSNPPQKSKNKVFFPSPTYVHLHLLTKNVTFAANVIHTSTSFNAIVSPPLSPVLSLTFLHTQRVRQCFFFHGGRRFFVNILDKIVDFQKYFLRNRCRLQIVGTKSISRAGLADLHVKVLPRIAEAQWSMPPLCQSTV